MIGPAMYMPEIARTIMEATPKENAEGIRGIVEVAIKIVVPVLLGVVSFMAMAVLNHESELAGIKASRFTTQDGAKLQMDLTSKLMDIHEAIHALEGGIPDSKRFDKLEDSVDTLKSDVAEIKADLRTRPGG